jgi:hypothetical protein
MWIAATKLASKAHRNVGIVVGDALRQGLHLVVARRQLQVPGKHRTCGQGSGIVQSASSCGVACGKLCWVSGSAVTDLRLAVMRNIDTIATRHAHCFMCRGQPPPRDTAQGDAPGARGAPPATPAQPPPRAARTWAAARPPACSVRNVHRVSKPGVLVVCQCIAW